MHSWNSTGEIGRIGIGIGIEPRHIVTLTSGFSARCRPMRSILPVEFQLNDVQIGPEGSRRRWQIGAAHMGERGTYITELVARQSA